MVLTVAPLSYRSVQIVDPITGNAATVVAGALTVSSSGGGGGSVTQGTVPWVVSGGGTAGTAATGVVTIQGIASMTKLLVTPDAGSTVQLVPGTSGGVTRTRTIIPNNTTNIIIKGSAGQLYALWGSSNSATIAYVKVYDAASATAGAGTPVDTLQIPSPAAGGGGGFMFSVPAGIPHTTGITLIITTGIADNDTTAPAASTYIVTAYFK